ncbi:uncharacterized protein LOC122387325 [Amphibalanus amphitrite]|uniref:uncharacterized protein LOC122387325 n=1 Tax=Amphibalanus amphitrite TaxID=1232801 RepID=UPI001C924154|nr:uncharacterized protein LOC122387325 [Amphibalanus amphitrite]
MASTWSTATACLAAALLVVQLSPPSAGQYMSGYGTGPVVPGLLTAPADSGDPKYDDAKGASRFAALYYGQNGVGRRHPLPNHESPYKYRPPLYPSAALGTLPHQLPPLPLGVPGDLQYFK